MKKIMSITLLFTFSLSLLVQETFASHPLKGTLATPSISSVSQPLFYTANEFQDRYESILQRHPALKEIPRGIHFFTFLKKETLDEVTEFLLRYENWKPKQVQNLIKLFIEKETYPELYKTFNEYSNKFDPQPPFYDLYSPKNEIKKGSFYILYPKLSSLDQQSIDNLFTPNERTKKETGFLLNQFDHFNKQTHLFSKVEIPSKESFELLEGYFGYPFLLAYLNSFPHETQDLINNKDLSPLLLSQILKGKMNKRLIIKHALSEENAHFLSDQFLTLFLNKFDQGLGEIPRDLFLLAMKHMLDLYHRHAPQLAKSIRTYPAEGFYYANLFFHYHKSDRSYYSLPELTSKIGELKKRHSVFNKHNLLELFQNVPAPIVDKVISTLQKGKNWPLHAIHQLILIMADPMITQIFKDTLDQHAGTLGIEHIIANHRYSTDERRGTLKEVFYIDHIMNKYKPKHIWVSQNFKPNGQESNIRLGNEIDVMLITPQNELLIFENKSFGKSRKQVATAIKKFQRKLDQLLKLLYSPSEYVNKDSRTFQEFLKLKDENSIIKVHFYYSTSASYQSDFLEQATEMKNNFLTENPYRASLEFSLINTPFVTNLPRHIRSQNLLMDENDFDYFYLSQGKHLSHILSKSLSKLQSKENNSGQILKQLLPHLPFLDGWISKENLELILNSFSEEFVSELAKTLPDMVFWLIMHEDVDFHEMVEKKLKHSLRQDLFTRYQVPLDIARLFINNLMKEISGSTYQMSIEDWVIFLRTYRDILPTRSPFIRYLNRNVHSNEDREFFLDVAINNEKLDTYWDKKTLLIPDLTNIDHRKLVNTALELQIPYQTVYETGLFGLPSQTIQNSLWLPVSDLFDTWNTLNSRADGVYHQYVGYFGYDPKETNIFEAFRVFGDSEIFKKSSFFPDPFFIENILTNNNISLEDTTLIITDEVSAVPIGLYHRYLILHIGPGFLSPKQIDIFSYLHRRGLKRIVYIKRNIDNRVGISNISIFKELGFNVSIASTNPYPSLVHALFQEKKEDPSTHWLQNKVESLLNQPYKKIPLFPELSSDKRATDDTDFTLLLSA